MPCPWKRPRKFYFVAFGGGFGLRTEEPDRGGAGPRGGHRDLPGRGTTTVGRAMLESLGSVGKLGKASPSKADDFVKVI